MKSLEELKAIREQMKKQMDVRDQSDSNIRVAVGMATCGIAAGAKPVLAAFLDEIQKRDLHGVTVTQTGCIGLCQYEPIVEVMEPGKPKVTYIKMTPDKAEEIVERHLIGGHVVDDYTLSSTDIK